MNKEVEKTVDIWVLIAVDSFISSEMVKVSGAVRPLRKERINVLPRYEIKITWMIETHEFVTLRVYH
nr:2-18 CRISPR MLO1 [Cucumis sativus]